MELTFEAPLARIRLNSPARRNAVSRAMWRALPGICAAIEARADALVVVVEGAGGHFCAGADISEFDEVYRDALATRDYVDAIQDGLSALAALDRPTIARLSGVAVGGGLALAISCDLRFCAADAHLAITPAKLGLVYGHVETRRLVELVGPARAKDLLFSGRRIEPAEALAIGLVDRLAPPEALEGSVGAYAAKSRRAEPEVDPRRQTRGRRDSARHERGERQFSRRRRGRRAGRGFRRGARRLRRQARADLRLSRADLGGGLERVSEKWEPVF